MLSGPLTAALYGLTFSLGICFKALMGLSVSVYRSGNIR